MKKALHISLAQTLFALEDDAYAKLDHYLRSIRAHFEQGEGADEILSDIESRIAEQFLETKKKVLTMVEVDAVIASMGAISDFGGDGGNAHEKHREYKQSAKPQYKKLYRNPDDKILGGVASGLAAYLNIDALWVRLAFVLLTFGTGFGILLYIILWIITPEAKTPSQKLEMAGSEITLETISESVKEKIEEVKKNDGGLKRIARFPFIVLGKIVSFIFRRLVPLVRVLVAVVLAIGSFAVLIGLTFALFTALSISPERYFEFPIFDVVSHTLAYTLLSSAYLSLIIPAMFFFIVAISMMKKKNVLRPIAGFMLAGIWALSLVVAGVSGVKATLAMEEYVQTSPLFAQVEKTVPLTGSVTSLSVASPVHITLIQGDKISLIAKGRAKDMTEVTAVIKDGVLSISAEELKHPDTCIFCDFSRPELVLTLPSLKALALENNSSVSNSAWKSSDAFELQAKGGSRANLNITVPEISVTASEGAYVELIGASASTTLVAGSSSRIDAESLQSARVLAEALESSSITLSATETLSANAKNGSVIRYYGNPKITESASSGSRIRSLEEAY